MIGGILLVTIGGVGALYALACRAYDRFPGRGEL